MPMYSMTSSMKVGNCAGNLSDFTASPLLILLHVLSVSSSSEICYSQLLGFGIVIRN